METWFLIIVTACLGALLKAFLSLKSKPKLPPGPGGVPIINSIKWVGASSTDLEAYLRSLRDKFGPIITVHLTSRPAIFVSSHALAHQALVQNGAIFADRAKPNATSKIATANQHNISSAGYGPTWRILRRNLTSQILHPSRLKEYSHARKWVLDILITRFASAGDNAIKVVDHFQFAMFCLLVLMCFGDKLEESKIKEVEDVQRSLMVSFNKFQVLNFFPRLTRLLLWKRWELFFSLRKRQREVLLPLIRARQEINKQDGEKPVSSYVDTLLNLEIQDDNSGRKRELTEDELISACSEFLGAGTDTTSTALQWIMANLVKYPEIQARLFDEIRKVVGAEAEYVGEEDLPRMPYLKAVVLEGLRRHPPGHFVLPHTVTQETELGGYVMPKNAVINFTVAEMGWDPQVWEDPMEFKPKRFLPAKGSDVEFDITCSREIKMMPFGAGRRICPGFGLAILHLEYFVANLVSKFEWAAAKGHEVDLSEKQEFTIVMKHPLHAHISPRCLSLSI
uniref:Cytochrome P450 89A2-like n=1 Tax=Opuntia streptacantha TaxID=393608 RepID=A0A7C9F359_OPUST